MSTTTVTTTKTLKTTAKAAAIKITKITTTTIVREEVSKEEAGRIAPGTATVTASTCTVKGGNPITTATLATTATFREGKNGVSFFLIDITHAERGKHRTEDNLIEHVKDTIRILEARSGKTIELMYIGKTHCDVDKRKKKPFDRLNHEHWTLNGINSRWTSHQKNPKVPSDGMVVLCAFTQHDLPAAGPRRSQEYLALTMEQRLIEHFQLYDTEKIVVNEEYKPGNTTHHTKDTSRELSVSVLFDNSDLDLTPDNPIPPEPKYCAYVVYMTYSYLPPKGKWKDLRKKQKIALEKQREEQEKRLKKPKDKDDSDTDSGEDEATARDDSVQDEESITSPLFHSTPISSPTSALSSKENIQPLSSPLSTVKRDLLPALLQTV